MKNLLLSISLLCSASLLAETYSEKNANAMMTVLKSQEMKQLLSQNDGVGNITKVEIINSVTTDIAHRVKVSFKSFGGIFSDEIICSIVARVDGVDGTGFVTLGPQSCEGVVYEDIEAFCENRSPIGCLD